MGDAEQKDLHGTKITKQLLKSQSGEFDLESIRILKLQNCDIDNLGCISECIGLERLDLSENDISLLQALTSLKQLCFLNLSANRITNIDPLRELESLQTLNVAGNLIGSFSNLQCLKELDSLETIRLRDTTENLSNPVCNSLTYRETMREMFPHLKTLDGERISGKGSELFDMFRELDTEIEKGSKPNHALSQSTGPWMSTDFWDRKRSDEEVDLQQAETNFNEILQECRKLNAVATHSLASGPKT
ncbi:leucine-rich repeat-containing protein 61-like [Amphiura filiformis]|uniref:leucine-rich repeat-containing protein 61-like n=1 Tax=Amphiura filiformis TaxID=82378 RepID=UPI003B21F269